MKFKKGILFLIMIAVIAVVGWKNKDFLMKKAEDVKVEMTAEKTMNDLRKSNIKYNGEHTDRDEFDNLLWTIRPESSLMHIDSETPVPEKSEDYHKEVFRKYTGIEDKTKVKFVSFSGPSWEEDFVVDEGETIYSTDHFFAVLVLANSEDDAKNILEQMKNNLTPWDWKTEDVVVDEDGQCIFVDVPHGEIKEDDMHFYRNGEYILFVINDKNAIESGIQKDFDYMTKLLDKALEETRSYYASQEN